MATPDQASPKTKTKLRQATRGADTGAVANESWRTSNIGRLLNEAVRKFESRVLEKMALAGHDECTLSHINVTRNLDLRGTRSVELARRASMTKQSLGELVTQLETLQIVRREPDPTDGRAKVIYFTEAGKIWLDNFHAALAEAEAEMQSALGDALYSAVKGGLDTYVRRSD